MMENSPLLSLRVVGTTLLTNTKLKRRGKKHHNRLTKTQAVSDEQTAKAELWKALTNSLNQKNNQPVQPIEQPKSNNQQQKVYSKNESNLEKRAERFGKMVADNFPQCDPKGWITLKKKVMDLFFDYEQQKENVPITIDQIDQQLSLQPGMFTNMLQQNGNINPQSQGQQGLFSPDSNY